MAKVSLLDEAVTFDIAYAMGRMLRGRGIYEEAKVFHLTALGGQRKVLG